MLHYKVNYLDPRGRVVGRFEFYCPSDVEAEQACEDLPDPRTRELWCGARWIRAWAAPLKELRQVSREGARDALRAGWRRSPLVPGF